ncbi:protein O-mannosyl-transferase [Gammaproteobacteria bacterium]
MCHRHNEPSSRTISACRLSLNTSKFALVLLIASLLIAATLYGGSLGAPFFFDDQQNIVHNPYVQPEKLSWESLKAAAAAYSGFPGRPVATISFALNYLVTGLSPTGFKAVNLAIHLICGFVLFTMVALILRTAGEFNLSRLDSSEQIYAAALTTALWILHPLHVSTVLYSVQRMAMLATLFCLLGLHAYLIMRRRQIQGQSSFVPFLLLITSGLLASLSKESGMLLLPMCGVMELGLFRLRASQPVVHRMVAGFWWGLLILLLVGGLVLLPQLIDWLMHGYAGREFTLFERVLTQPRVLLLYLRLLLVPDIGAMTLYHDDLLISRDWFSPMNTLPAMISMALLLMSSIIGLDSRYRVAAMGGCLFFVGHALESTVIPLEMVFEHRNYLPSTGLFLALASTWTGATKGMGRNISVFLLLVALAVLCGERARIFSHTIDMVSFTLKNHPGSLRTQLWTGDTFLVMAKARPNDDTKWLDLAIKHYRIAAKLDPYDVISLFQIFELEAQLERSLNSADFSELARRLREGPVRPGTIIANKDFLDHIVDGSNPFPVADALMLTDLLLANPRCEGRGRAMILNAVATLLVELNADFDSAIARSREATALQPQDPSIWIPYIVILFKAGRLDAAEQALRAAQAVDRGPFRDGLNQLLIDIQNQRQTVEK